MKEMLIVTANRQFELLQLELTYAKSQKLVTDAMHTVISRCKERQEKEKH